MPHINLHNYIYTHACAHTGTHVLTENMPAKEKQKNTHKFICSQANKYVGTVCMKMRSQRNVHACLLYRKWRTHSHKIKYARPHMYTNAETHTNVYAHVRIPTLALQECSTF